MKGELQSIVEDSLWIQCLHDRFREWGIVTNHRCGTWYVPPQLVDSTCYFKSTDGHPEALRERRMFGLRRLNLHLLRKSFLNQHRGLIIIDSTKNPQKLFPDSFTRTIPVWCCVINRIISQWKESWGPYTSLQMHPSISEEERSRVETLLPSMVQELISILGISNGEFEIKNIVHTLQNTLKPFKLFWCSRENEDEVFDAVQGTHEFYPIILANPSRSSSGNYIQGAADDEEGWAKGLTPYLFWEHSEQLLVDSSEIVLENIMKSHALHLEDFRRYDFLSIGRTHITVNTPKISWSMQTPWTPHSKEIVVLDLCSISLRDGETSEILGLSGGVEYFHFPIANHKKQRHNLENTLNQIFSVLQGKLNKHCNVVVWSMPDHNIALTVCLALLLHYYDLNGNLLPSPRNNVNKALIKQFCIFICQYQPHYSLPKAFVKMINRFFLTPAHLKPKDKTRTK